MPFIAHIWYTYVPPGPGWPQNVGDTWDFSKRTVISANGLPPYFLDNTVTRRATVLHVEDLTVPAGTFSCFHLEERDIDPVTPANPVTGEVTYEHWFNADVVGSDVKMIDSDTYKGTETRVLTSFDWEPPVPPPTTTSLNPTSKIAGEAAFTLTVNGTNFVAGSKVRWNGTDRTTNYVSGTQLTAAVTAADIASAGTADVTVFTPAPGGGTSNAQTFTVTEPPPTDSITPGQLGNGHGNKKAPVTITGTGFQTKAKAVLRMAGQKDLKVKIETLSATVITGTVKLKKAVPGDWDIVLLNPDKTTQTLACHLKVTPHPVITGIAPINGTTGTSVALTINGSNFVGAGMDVRLTKGAKDLPIIATGVTVNPAGTQITCNLNLNTGLPLTPVKIGAWKVIVKNADGGIHKAPSVKFKVLKVVI